MANYRVIGTPVERVDGPEMLCGQALYGPDVKLPGMLSGRSAEAQCPMQKFCASTWRKRSTIRV